MLVLVLTLVVLLFNRTSFGATAPPFIDYLQDILRRYPDGGQILKVGTMLCQISIYNNLFL